MTARSDGQWGHDHSGQVIRNRNRKFACEYCGRMFFSARDHLGHVNSAHLHLKPFVCDICQRSFAGKKTLNNHRKGCVERSFK